MSLIQTPRRIVFDWYGVDGMEPRAGSFLRTKTGRTYYVVSARRVAVRVTRGETLRLRFEVVLWEGDTPGRVYEIEWNAR